VTESKTFLVAGYILNNAFSLDQANWSKLCSLILDHLYAEEKRITGKDLVESLNVAMARFVDTIIDYPNSKLYVKELVEKLVEMQMLTEKQAVNYKLHLENIERQNFE